MIKINNFWGDLSDISAKTATLPITLLMCQLLVALEISHQVFNKDSTYAIHRLPI